MCAKYRFGSSSKVYMRERFCARKFLCAKVSVLKLVKICTHTRTHAHTHTRTHTSKHTYAHAHIHMYTHTHRHTHTHTHRHTHMHTYTHTHIHTCAHIHTHTATSSHTYWVTNVNFLNEEGKYAICAAFVSITSHRPAIHVLAFSSCMPNRVVTSHGPRTYVLKKQTRRVNKAIRDRLQIMGKKAIWLVKDYVTKKLIG